MIIWSGTYVSFESLATVEPRQHISNIYIYLYVSDQSVFSGSEYTSVPFTPPPPPPPPKKKKKKKNPGISSNPYFFLKF